MFRRLTEAGREYFARAQELERLSERQKRTIESHSAQLRQSGASERQLKRELKCLQRRIEQLEERLRKNSGNSSLPPDEVDAFVEYKPDGTAADVTFSGGVSWSAGGRLRPENAGDVAQQGVRHWSSPARLL